MFIFIRRNFSVGGPIYQKLNLSLDKLIICNYITYGDNGYMKRKFCSGFGFRANNVLYAAVLALQKKKAAYGYEIVEGLFKMMTREKTARYEMAMEDKIPAVKIKLWETLN